MGVVTWKPVCESYDQWLIERNKSLGSSEVSVVVFGNQYTSNLELFYQKLGAPVKKLENLRMFIGKETEELSANFWRHYAGTEQSIVDNIRKKTPVKDCVNLNATAFNSDYPFISTTPDRKILPVLQYEGRGFGSLEIKNTNTQVIRGYESLIPTDNLIQVVTQMMVTEWKYSELFYFLDNRSVLSHFIERKHTKNTEETILLHAIPFWQNVIKGRPLFNQLFEAKRNYNMKLAAEIETELATLEPPAQQTLGYMNFITDRYKDRLQGAGIIQGSQADLMVARKHKQVIQNLSKLEKEKLKLEIELKSIIKHNNVLDFTKNGKVTYYANKNGNRLLKNNTKV